VAGIGISSFLADLRHEIPTALLPSLLTVTLHAPASALGLIEGISDAAAGVARFAGGALADDPGRRRRVHRDSGAVRGDRRSGAMMVLRYGLVSGGVAGALAGGEPCAGPGEQGEPECGERVLDVVVGGSGLVAGQQGGQVRGCLGQVERPGGREGEAEDDQCCGEGEGGVPGRGVCGHGFSCSGVVVGRGVR
jgi:hypothetical protein